MINIEEQMNYFYKLNYEEKKQHLLKMLEKIKDKHEIFLKNYETLNTSKTVDESEIIYIYKLIFEVSNWLEDNQKATEKELMQKMKEQINKLREQERIIRERDQEEADKLLESI